MIVTFCLAAAATIVAASFGALILLDIARDRPDGRHRPEHAYGTRAQVLRDDPTMPIDLAEVTG
jgi:hypothetical protein